MTWQETLRWRVHWFNKWERVLDDALSSLPEDPQWPTGLRRTLFEVPSPFPKKIALVLDHGAPIAMVGLRVRRRDMYEPLGQYFIPGFLLAGEQGLAASILMRLQVPLTVSWWRMPWEPPSGRAVRSSKSAAHYIMDLSEDPEVYWRSSNHFPLVRSIRNRCRKFTFAVNCPGGAEWVIRNWVEDWNIGREEIEERLVAARYLETLGKHYSLLLLDGHKVVAGNTLIVHTGDVVGLLTHRDRAYDRYSVGTHLMDLSFSWAKQSGFRRYDLGTADVEGTIAYKSRWAPATSQRWALLEICPEFHYRLRQFKGYGSAVRRLLGHNWLARSAFRRLPSGIRHAMAALRGGR